MVWGMNMPKGLGEFWPDGEFEEWYDHLRVYYVEQMPEDQKSLFDDGLGRGAMRYSSFAVAKFISEVGAASSPDMPPYTLIESHESPRFFTAEKWYKSLGSLIKLNDRILAVDKELKGIVERLEPDTHRFFPIEIRMPKGTALTKPYYVLFIGQYHDSFSPEDSQEGSWRANGPHKYFPTETKKGVSGLAFNKAVFGNAHLWRERRLGTRLTCFSDKLQAEIAEVGLKLPKHYKMKEV